MKFTAIPLVSILVSGLFVLIGQQQPKEPRIFTAAQAEAGRATYERTCGRCHTPALSGRHGDKGELPPIGSLPESYQKFIGPRGFVPPLAGKVFLERWGSKTAAELIARFQITADDPFFQFEGMNADAVVNITAYVLEVNGAKAGTQPLTRTTGAAVGVAAAEKAN